MMSIYGNRRAPTMRLAVKSARWLSCAFTAGVSRAGRLARQEAKSGCCMTPSANRIHDLNAESAATSAGGAFGDAVVSTSGPHWPPAETVLVYGCLG